MIGPEEAIRAGLHHVREIIELNCDNVTALVDCGYQGKKKKQKDPRRVVYEFILSCGPGWWAAMGLSVWLRKEESDTVQPSLTGDPWYLSKQDYLGQPIWVVDFDPNHFKHLSHGSYMIQPIDKDGERAREYCW